MSISELDTASLIESIDAQIKILENKFQNLIKQSPENLDVEFMCLVKLFHKLYDFYKIIMLNQPNFIRKRRLSRMLPLFKGIENLLDLITHIDSKIKQILESQKIDSSQEIKIKINKIRAIRGNIENNFHDLRRPWFLFLCGPFIVIIRNAYYSNSIVQKIIVGLGYSTTFTIAILIFSIGWRVVALEKNRTSHQTNYEEIHKKLFQIQKDRFTILTRRQRISDLKIKISDLETQRPENSNNSNLRQTLKKEEQAIKDSYQYNNQAFARIVEGKNSDEEKNPNEGKQTQTEDQTVEYFFDDLNMIMIELFKTSQLDTTNLSNIFLFLDDNVSDEQINLSIKNLDQILNIISEELRKHSFVFSNTAGITDSITLILIVAAFGVFGSIFSILIRVTEIDTDPSHQSNDPLIPILVGLFRPFIGGFSSIFIFALASSGVVSSSVFTNGNTFYLFIAISFISGFSERLVTDFIEDTASKMQPKPDNPSNERD